MTRFKKQYNYTAFSRWWKCFLNRRESRRKREKTSRNARISRVRMIVITLFLFSFVVLSPFYVVYGLYNDTERDENTQQAITFIKMAKKPMHCECNPCENGEYTLVDAYTRVYVTGPTHLSLPKIIETSENTPEIKELN